MLDLCFYAGSGSYYLQMCRKKMATETFVTQFICSYARRRKVSQHCKWWYTRFLQYLQHSCSPSFPRRCYLVASVEMAHLSTPNTSCILNCSFLQTPKFSFFFRTPKSFRTRFSVACNTMLIDKGGH